MTARIPSFDEPDFHTQYEGDYCRRDGCEAIVDSDQKYCDEHTVYFTHG